MLSADNLLAAVRKGDIMAVPEEQQFEDWLKDQHPDMWKTLYPPGNKWADMQTLIDQFKGELIKDWLEHLENEGDK